jgi:hypothetical protein
MSYRAPLDGLGWQSEPVDLLTFDLSVPLDPSLKAHDVAIRASRPGLCQGVMQWLWIDVDGTSSYENRPGAIDPVAIWHWPPVFFPFETPMAVMAGESVTVQVSHDQRSVQILFRRIG